MKSNAIVRIVVFSLLIILLLGLLGGLLLVDSYGYVEKDPVWVIPMVSDVSGEVRRFDYVSPYEELITQIEVDWAAGTITIQPGDTEQVRFSETCPNNSGQLVYAQKGSKLTIRYQEQDVYFGIQGTQPKDLTITVPRDWEGRSIEIDAASAQLEIRDINVRQLDFEGASGTGTLENCRIGELDISTVSGDIDFTGTLESLDYEGVSAKLTAVLADSPKRMELESVSGDLDLTLPESCGFTAAVDAVSGDFSSDFSVSKEKDTYTCGDGSCRITVSGVSGDVAIRKGN